MENRFGIKDFFLIALLLVVIVLIVLSMVEVDRQWKSIQFLQEQSRQQGRDLIEIRRTLAEGIAVTTPTTQQASTQNASGKQWVDPFKPVKDADKMPGFARGDWLVENMSAKVKAITPFIGEDVYAYYVQGRVQEGLLYRDVDSLDKIEPGLALSWKQMSDTQWRFNLRKGVKFHDGSPFTADDVVFSFGRIKQPQGTNQVYVTGINEVKKIDDYTVEFTFKEFFFKSLETVGNTLILPRHFYSKFAPEKFNETPGLLMGTGAYKLGDPSSWTPGQPLILLRNDRYWGTPQGPDRLVFYEVEEEAAQQTMFSNREIDVWVASSDQFVKMKDDPKVLEHATPMDYLSMIGGYFYVAWNERYGDQNAPTAFTDKRVRQAMTMLIDRESICKQIFLGYASVPTGPFAPGSKQADPNVKPWPFDPERACKLLTECGIYDRDGDGVLDLPDGKPFKFTLTFGNKYAPIERMTLLMKDTYAKYGIIMERDPIEWPLLQNKLKHHQFDAIFLGWSGAVDDDPYQMFHSNQIADQGDNSMSYSSPECDTAIVAARTCVEDQKRQELWHKVHRIIAEDCPYTFMVNRRSTVFVDKRWQNVRTSTIGTNYNRLDFDPIPWFVPAKQQKYK